MTTRYDAPQDLRDAVISLAYECGLSSKDLKPLICDYLTDRTKEKYWPAEYISQKIEQIFAGVKWFEVYDIIERIADHLKTHVILGTVANNRFTTLTETEHVNDFETDGHFAKPVRDDRFFEEQLNKQFLRKT